MDYTALENDFECACQDVIATLKTQYTATYHSGGAAILENFLELIRHQFETAGSKFIESNNLTDAEALKRIRSIAKKHAKTCLDYYGKVA